MTMNRTNADRRVALVATTDEHTRLTPGAEGTLRYERECPISGRTVAVDWDSGSTLTLLLDEGDAFRFLD